MVNRKAIAHFRETHTMGPVICLCHAFTLLWNFLKVGRELFRTIRSKKSPAGGSTVHSCRAGGLCGWSRMSILLVCKIWGWGGGGRGGGKELKRVTNCEEK